MQERLQKILSRAGIASRRESETIITDGRVAVNGEVVTELGTKADPEPTGSPWMANRSLSRDGKAISCSTSLPAT